MHNNTEMKPIAHSTAKAKSALLFGIFVAGIGNSFVFAILPPIGREMGFAELQIGSIITASAFVFMLSAPWWGAKSEVWGRKPVILIALSVYCLTTALFAFVVQLRLAGALSMVAAYGLLVALRVLFAGGICGIFPASQAYMADITSLEERMAGMSLIGIAMGVGMIAGPGIAAAFSGFGLALPFYAVAALAIPAGVLAYLYIQDVPREIHPAQGKSDGIAMRELLPFLFISTFIMINMSAIQQASAFYFQDKFDLSAVETARAVGLALMESAVASVSAQVILVQRIGLSPKTLLRTGVPCSMIGVLLLLTMDQYPMLVLAMAFFGLGMGQIMPGTIASISMKAGLNQQGRVAGINTSAQGLGFIIGPLIGSGLYTVHPLLPFQICLGLLALLMINVYFIAKLPG